MIHVEIDELTPCLVDNLTGERIDTEVVRIVRKSFLQKFSKSKGWYTNWADELKAGHEVYALVLKGTVAIQGLISLHNDPDMDAVFMDWACASPSNNKQIQPDIQYKGVGGHLFAIAAQKSFDYGHDGFLVGFAANHALMEYYCKAFGAEAIRIMHPYQIAIDTENSKKLLEVYDYEWTNEEL